MGGAQRGPLEPQILLLGTPPSGPRQPVKPGEPGVLVFTHIGWRGTVLVRYWTGDLIHGGMIRDRCPHCGWTFPRIFPPICRAEADFSKIKGARVELPLLIEPSSCPFTCPNG
jgi:phenylacetate-CoA ligase